MQPIIACQHTRISLSEAVQTLGQPLDLAGDRTIAGTVADHPDHVMRLGALPTVTHPALVESGVITVVPIIVAAIGRQSSQPAAPHHSVVDVMGRAAIRIVRPPGGGRP